MAANSVQARVGQLEEAVKHDDPDDPGNPSVNFQGEQRSNETHESSTDPDPNWPATSYT